MWSWCFRLQRIHYELTCSSALRNLHLSNMCSLLDWDTLPAGWCEAKCGICGPHEMQISLHLLPTGSNHGRDWRTFHPVEWNNQIHHWSRCWQHCPKGWSAQWLLPGFALFSKASLTTGSNAKAKCLHSAPFESKEAHVALGFFGSVITLSFKLEILDLHPCSE